MAKATAAALCQVAREAVAKYPDDPEAWYLLGEAQLHVRAAFMGWEEIDSLVREFRNRVASRPAPKRSSKASSW